MKQLLLLATAAATIAMATPAAATDIYRNDFDSPNYLAPGVGFSAIDPTSQTANTAAGPWNAAGWSGRFYRNYTTGLTQLTFTNLPTHTSITVNAIIGLLDSWDSINGTPAPDLLSILFDGTLVAQLTGRTGSGTTVLTGGGTVLAEGVQADQFQFYSDTLIDLTNAPAFTIAHTASTFTLGFQAGGVGYQSGTVDGGDESWGLDNLAVTFEDANAGNAVPEPSTWMMMLLGMGAVGWSMRRKAQRQSVRYGFA